MPRMLTVTLGIAGLEVRAQTPRELEAVMVPAKGYLPETANGISPIGFGIEPDGRIAFDPAAAGSYVIRISSQPNPPKLETRSPCEYTFAPRSPQGNSPRNHDIQTKGPSFSETPRLT